MTTNTQPVMRKIFANDRYEVFSNGDAKWHIYSCGLLIPHDEGSIINNGEFHSLAFIDRQGNLHHGIGNTIDLSRDGDDEAIIKNFIMCAASEKGEAL